MIRYMPESRLLAKVNPVREHQDPFRAGREPTGLTRQIRVIHLGIRYPIHLGSNRVPGMPSKPLTDMTMVTRPWSGPGTQDSEIWRPRVHSVLGWELASYRCNAPTPILYSEAM